MIRTLVLSCLIIFQVQGTLETLTSYDGFTSVGGDGGNVWTSGFEYSGGIKEIQAWIAYGGAVNSMNFELFDGRTMFVGREQYGAAYTSNIVFSPGEKVVGSIYVCEDSYWPFVSCIEFSTSYGQSFSSCDYNVANCRYLSASVNEYTLSGVFGRSGTSINQIGFYARIGEDNGSSSNTTAAPTESTSTTADSADSEGSSSAFSYDRVIGVVAGSAIGLVLVIGASACYINHGKSRPAPVAVSKAAPIEIGKRPVEVHPVDIVVTGEKEYDPEVADGEVPPPAYNED